MFPSVLQFVVLCYGILLHRLRRSPLPEGAFGTTTFGADFIHIMFIGIAYIEPRDYRVVFLIQKAPVLRCKTGGFFSGCLFLYI